jgi:tetratricopeptide (TPR) repeat protein
LVLDNFSESSNKFFQAYLINKKDTLQLYNAAVSYKNALDADLSLKCFEELKTINYSGNIPIYIAFNRNTLTDEYFDTMDERDSKIQSGSHIKPRIVLSSKKPEIYKSIVLFYIQKGYKEKAMKVIEKARDLNYLDQSLAFIEANLYLETKDYDYFDKLAASIIESNPNNPEILITLGIKCQNEMYDTAAEYYYKKAIALDPNILIAYVNLSALLVNKSIIITAKMNELGSLPMNKKSYEELKIQNEQINKMLVPYFQKIVSIDPFNSSVSQLISSVNMSKNNSNQSFASSDD